MDPRLVAVFGPGLRVKRQAQPDRRITRSQIAALIAQEPGPGLPALRRHAAALDWQDVTGHLVEALAENPAQALAFKFVVEFRIEGVDIGRQAPFTPQVVPGVFEGGEDLFRVQFEPRGKGAQKPAGIQFGDTGVHRFVGQQ